MAKYSVTWSHPTVIVYHSEVEAESEKNALRIANEQDKWEQVEMDAYGLCHQCSDADDYEITLEES